MSFIEQNNFGTMIPMSGDVLETSLIAPWHLLTLYHLWYGDPDISWCARYVSANIVMFSDLMEPHTCHLWYDDPDISWCARNVSANIAMFSDLMEPHTCDMVIPKSIDVPGTPVLTPWRSVTTWNVTVVIWRSRYIIWCSRNVSAIASRL